jgi:N4-gp56 family major capsid protein
MTYGQGQGEIPFNVGKDIKAGFIYDVREQIMVSKFAGKCDLAKRKGDMVERLRLHTPDPVTTELLGSNEPVMSEHTYEKIQFKLKRYSSWFPLHGHIIKTHDDPYFEMAMESAKEQAARSVETLGVDIITNGASVFYSTGTSRAETKDYLRKGLMDVNQRYLEINETKPITKMYDSTSNWGEEALDACFITIAPHELAQDFRDLPGFVRVEDYSSRIKPMMHEIGTYNRSRVLCSGFFKPLAGAGASLTVGEQADIINTGGNADVFQVVTFGKDAFDFGGLQGESAVELHVHNAKVSDTDKNGNKGHVSWEVWFGGVVTQNKYLSRIECVAKTDSKLAA